MQKIDDDYKRLEAKIDLLLAGREDAKIVEERQAKITEAKLAVHKDLVEFLKRLEKAIGRSADNNPGFSIMGRLDALDFSVGELLERARDPEANREYFFCFSAHPFLIIKFQFQTLFPPLFPRPQFATKWGSVPGKRLTRMPQQ